ncbi:MAG: PilZ domain-containing protein [Candidatus Aminicenantales bacterium]
MLWRKRRIKRRRQSTDRRREPRFADGIEIILASQETATEPSGRRSYCVRTKDASPSGLRVESDDPIPVGTVLCVSLKSPKTKKDIRATAEVKWTNRVRDGETYEWGLEFVMTTVRNILDLVEHIYKS